MEINEDDIVKYNGTQMINLLRSLQLARGDEIDPYPHMVRELRRVGYKVEEPSGNQ